MMKHTDDGGNLWHQQEKFEDRHNHGVRGAHVCIPFQCEECWILNMEGRDRLPDRDDLLVMMIRRANLDAMSSRAESTIASHAAEVKRSIKLCEMVGKTPDLLRRGPMPVSDPVGMGLAVEMLIMSVVSRPRLKGQEFIQFDTMRKPRAMHSLLWRSSPPGVAEGSAFAGGFAKLKATKCPSQSDWFGYFLQGAEARMGYASQSNRPLHIKTIVRVLDSMEEQIPSCSVEMGRQLVKVGAAIVTALAGSLRGPEVLMLDLGGIRQHIHRGRDGILPNKPMKVGIDLTGAPHVYLALVGKFKGELGLREHLIAVASTTRSGVKVRWWLEQLIQVREEEGHSHGPAFGNADGSLCYLSDYDAVLHDQLRTVQQQPDSCLDKDDDIEANYSFFRTFRKSAEDRARAAHLDSNIQNAMNRWKKIERAKGKRPRFDMIDHYSSARALMPVTWRYSYVQ